MKFQAGNTMGKLAKGRSKFIGKFKAGDTFGKWTVVDGILGDDHYKRILVRCECGHEQLAFPTRLLNGTSVGCRRCTASGKNHYKWSGIGELPATMLYTIKQNARAKNRIVDVDLEYLWNLFQNQNGKCALSGQEIYLMKSNTKWGRDSTASLDRIDSNGNYTKGNVQWVHKDINRMKTDFSQDRFVYLCKLVADNV